MTAWQLDYNTVPPHSSLGNLPRADYAKFSAPASQRHGPLRSIGCYAPRPVAAASLLKFKMTIRLYPSVDENWGAGHGL